MIGRHAEALMRGAVLKMPGATGGGAVNGQDVPGPHPPARVWNPDAEDFGVNQPPLAVLREVVDLDVVFVADDARETRFELADVAADEAQYRVEGLWRRGGHWRGCQGDHADGKSRSCRDAARSKT
jgi:hypothetical protein